MTGRRLVLPRRAALAAALLTLIFGASVASAANVDTLTGASLRLSGASAGDASGFAVSVGDVNGDGRPDVVVGAPGASSNGRSHAGSAYVVFGQAHPTDLNLGSLGARGFRIDGAAAGDALGVSVTALGDVNGDGLADVAVGAPGAGAARGAAFVVFGKSSTSTVNTAALGSQGYRIDGAADGDLAGTSLAGVGDLNGDGRPDVLIGAPGAGPGTGAGFVVFGSSATSTVSLASLGSRGYRIDGGRTALLVGVSVASLPDMNGDGRPDLLVGAPGSSNNGRPASGSAFVVYGKSDSAAIALDSLGSRGYRIDGPRLGALLGTSASAGGDVNGDGRQDLVLGAPGTAGKGAAFVVYGKSDNAAVDLASAGKGYQISGATLLSALGTSVAGVGDVNGDGRPDVLVGAPGSSNNGRIASGSAYVVYGRSSDVSVAGLGAADGYRIDGAATRDLFGTNVASAGDANGDGTGDFLVGAPGASSLAGAAVEVWPQAPNKAATIAGVSLSGDARDGSTLTGSDGTVAGTDPIVVTRSWQLCAADGSGCVPIAGADGSTLALTGDMAGKTVRYVVDVSNASLPGGGTAQASALSGVIQAIPPSLVTAPTISGTPQVGQPLTVSNGTWTGSRLGYSYQWQECGRYPGAVLSDDPLAYWRLGETSGSTAADSSGRSTTFPGTYEGGVALGQPGAIASDDDKSIALDGSSGFVSIPGLSNALLSPDFTLEIWLNVPDAEQDKGIIGKWKFADGGGLLLWLDTDGNYSLSVTKPFTRAWSAPMGPTPGWHHVVAAFTGTNILLYQDGVRIALSPTQEPAPIVDPDIDFQIGWYGNGPTQYLKGGVDEAAVYDHVLTPERIAAHYAAAQGPACVDIPGATGATYTPTDADAHALLQAVVTASNASLPGGGSASATTDRTSPVGS